MSILTLTDAVVCAGPLRLSQRARSVTLAAEAVELDATVLENNGWRGVVGGLKRATVSAAGFYDPDAVETGALPVDKTLFDALASTGVLTIAPASTDGGVCYVVRTVAGKLSMFGAAGELAPFDAEWASTAAVARGTVMHPIGTARTATGNGTGRQVGALSASQTMVCALHVVTVTGTTPSMTVTVQSDDNSGFTSPTTRATFTAATAATAQVLTVAGPVTDTWWRVVYTITGTTPSFRFLAALGIV